MIHKFLRASFYNFHAEQRKNGQNNVNMPSTRQFVPFSIHKNNSMQTEISQSCVRTLRKKKWKRDLEKELLSLAVTNTLLANVEG